MARSSPRRDIVVVGASAGGVEALSRLVHGLERDNGLSSLFVVLHVMPTGTSVLPNILDRSGPLRAQVARDGAAIEPGNIYVAPPDRHMLIRDNRVRVTLGARENGHRPAIDPTFRSAAETYGPRVVGVILSGSLDDGAAGLAAVKRAGGLAVVQDPRDALYGDMPASAMAATSVDHVLDVDGIAALLNEVAGSGDDDDEDSEDDVPGHWEPLMDELDQHETEQPASGFTCPECGGALWAKQEGELLQFKCRVGHVYSPESLVEEQGRSLEAAMWAALRALEERADLLRRVARRVGRRGGSDEHFQRRIENLEEQAETIRKAVTSMSTDVPSLIQSAEPATQE
ncbi:MAG TPA: chemotaxis protein CheB [Thermoleophilaceae bacterium]